MQFSKIINVSINIARYFKYINICCYKNQLFPITSILQIINSLFDILISFHIIIIYNY